MIVTIPNKSSNPEEHLAKARMIVRRDAPYMMSVLYGLVPYPEPGLGTMLTTEHMVLMYDPAWIMTLSEEVLAGILMHECMHVLRHHIQRFGDILAGDERYIANCAMDIAINPDLIDAGWKLTPGALMPEQYGLPKGLSAEQYFMEMRKKQPKQKQKQPQKGGSGDQSQGGGGDKEPKDKGDGDGQGQGQGDQPGQVCAGRCGGMSKNKGDAAKEDAVDKEIGRSEVDHQRIVMTTAEAIKRELESQQGRGKIPAGLIELVKRLEEPAKINWRHELNHVVRRATGRIKSGGKDFSIRRPSKRSFARGLIRPGLIQQMPEICVIRDTSGSMGQKQITEATNETIGIIKASGVDAIWFIDADVEVALVKRVRIQDFETLGVHGRGGTDFRPAIAAAVKLRPKPDIIIYVTDGDGAAPPQAPDGVEFIWCVVSSYYNKRPASWGHFISIDKDGND